MAWYLVKRITQAVVAFLAMTAIVFFLVRMTGDPALVYAGDYAGPEDRAIIAKYLGLDKPLRTQYWIFIKNMVKGDFGRSFAYGMPALTVVLERFPATLELTFAASLVATMIGVVIGVVAAVHRGRFWDNLARGFAMLGQSVPSFWLGIVLIFIVAVKLGWLPVGGRDGVQHLVLPAITMGWYLAAGIIRLTRSGMVEALEGDYVAFARSKGVNEWLVVWRHAFRNAMIPILTFASVMFVALLAGAIITETVFAWPGVGRLSIQSLMMNDFPVIQVIVLLLSALYLMVNLAVDVLYGIIDPRIVYK